MYKKILIAGIKLLILVAVVYGAARFVVVFKDSRLTGQRAPYVQSLASDSVIIHWLTDNNQVGVVHYGENSDHMSIIEIEDSPTKNHIIKLFDLKPETKYYYQVGEISGFQEFDKEKHWFYTQPEDIVATRVWVIGDSGKPGETVDQVKDAAIHWMQSNPLPADQAANTEGNKLQDKPLIDVWIALGDIAYRSGTNEQFQAALFDTFGDITSNTSLWPVYGNHDSRRWTYFRIFDLPENAEAGGVASETENYYSFDYSNIHFVMLDSQESDRSADGDMANWLKKDLAQYSLARKGKTDDKTKGKTWLIAAFHHPPYTKGSHDSDDSYDSRGRMHEMRENILPILESAGVDLVFSGHSHMYERSYLLDCAYSDSKGFTQANIVSAGTDNKHQKYLKPVSPKGNQGAVYVVAGSASRIDHGPLDHPAHHTGFLEAGSVVVDVTGNKLTARFINNEGLVRDEFSIEKDAEYSSSYKGCQK